MLRLIATLAFLLPHLALAAGEPGKRYVMDLGTLLDAKALNGAAATRTFTVGPRENNIDILGYDEIVLEHYFDYTATAGTITTTCKVGRTVATAAFSPTTCTTATGTCTVNMGGVFVTASLSADTKWVVRMRIEGYAALSCVVAHGGSPGATDKITVTGYLLGH
jgi:hypothetical protein